MAISIRANGQHNGKPDVFSKEGNERLMVLMGKRALKNTKRLYSGMDTFGITFPTRDPHNSRALNHSAMMGGYFDCHAICYGTSSRHSQISISMFSMAEKQQNSVGLGMSSGPLGLNHQSAMSRRGETQARLVCGQQLRRRFSLGSYTDACVWVISIQQETNELTYLTTYHEGSIPLVGL